MKQLILAERLCLLAHIGAMAFGLAGLVLVLPHPEFILMLPPFGQHLFQWSMAGGGVVYIILGAIAVAIYGYRTLGWRQLMGFMGPAVFLSLGSELLGTSTGFPFGNYAYLSGLGYKIAGLVPFTIPLSWFYLGLSAYLLAMAGMDAWLAGRSPRLNWGVKIGAVLLGTLLLTAWDFVLDPAMSQTPFPFWEFRQPGEFFGMPYRNLAGWMGTGALFMSVATLLWPRQTPRLTRTELGLPLMVYLTNFAFGAIITLSLLDSRYWIPATIGLGVGVIPAIACWWLAPKTTLPEPPSLSVDSAEVVPVAAVTLGAGNK